MKEVVGMAESDGDDSSIEELDAAEFYGRQEMPLGPDEGLSSGKLLLKANDHPSRQIYQYSTPALVPREELQPVTADIGAVKLPQKNPRADMEKTLEDIPKSKKPRPNEYITIPETPTMSYLPSRRETIRLNTRPNGNLDLVKQCPLPTQQSRRECVRKNLKGIALSARDVEEQDDLSPYFRSLQVHESCSDDFKEPTPDNSLSDEVPEGDSIDDIVQKLIRLSITDGNEIVESTVQNALVPYDDGRDEKMEMGNDEYWEEQRRIFYGYVDSFLTKVVPIQGDRHFSRWKGSVVDSVVGVFLTQNVSDHLSSSAFMTLAARFPPKSNDDINKPQIEKASKSMEVQENCVTNYEDSIDCPEYISSQFSDLESFLNPVHEQSAEKEQGHEDTANNSAATSKKASRTNKVKPKRDWDNLRKQACCGGDRKERSRDTMDSVDYEAIRAADVKVLADTIKGRGMNNNLAERIKGFLDRLVEDHGSIDLEWLRDVPPDDAKEYLLDIRGLGLKSAECVRLLTLQHVAFPVDINVARICVRLGWVPIEPLPEILQFHGLEMYPASNSIHQYIWHRLCKLDHSALYELHYHLITFGKVFCTKLEPNCKACPMKEECKHFKSKCASGMLALPAPEENPIAFLQLEGNAFNDGEPIVEEPTTSESETELEEYLERDIEDAFEGDTDDVLGPNLGNFPRYAENYLQENYMEVQVGDLSKALVTIPPDAASIPMPRLKNVGRLRTAHHVYELPDAHPLLEQLEPREPVDPCPYFLALWNPGETAQSTEQPQHCCGSQDSSGLCDLETCFVCNSSREEQAQTARGTILIPSRTALRGSFPLNGTYFQTNEVFADNESSINSIKVPRAWLANLPRRTVYFGSSVLSILKGSSTEEIRNCFLEGFICLRGFDRETRTPRPLQFRFHKSTTSTKKAGKPAAEASGEDNKHGAEDMNTTVN